LTIVISDRKVIADLRGVAAIHSLGISALIDVLVMREVSRKTGRSYGRLLTRTQREYKRLLRDRNISALEKVAIRRTLRQLSSTSERTSQ